LMMNVKEFLDGKKVGARSTRINPATIKREIGRAALTQDCSVYRLLLQSKRNAARYIIFFFFFF
jgi:hypothetical protein